jgi:methylenetetrahydrofolate reductase (NADPH)
MTTVAKGQGYSSLVPLHPGRGRSGSIDPPRQVIMNLGNRAQARGSDGTLGGAFDDVSYEVLPFRETEQKVVAHVAVTTPLTVTASPTRGIEPTVSVAERLAGHGYRVTPHLAARMIADDAHLGEIVGRLKNAGVDSALVIGGDSMDPVGRYADAQALLVALDTIGHHFAEIGIGGYPEGHAFIPDQVLTEALREKSRLASYIATQICFDATKIVEWARALKRRGIELPVRVGVPGAVSRRKLLRISLTVSVGDSVRFLQKQQSMFWRFLMPRGYKPNKLIRGLVPHLGAADNNLQGFNIFTFNDLETTERWRRRELARFSS